MFHHEVICSPRTVTVLITEVSLVGGNVYRTSLGNVFEFPPSAVHNTREAAEAAGVRDLFVISHKIKEYLKNGPQLL